MTSVALLAGALVAAGLVGIVSALSAHEPGPARPPGGITERLRLWWRSHNAGTERDRRRRRILLCAALIAVVGLWLITTVPAIGLGAGLAVLGTPWVWNAGARESRAIERLDAVTAWVSRLQSNMTTGMGLMAAVAANTETAPAAIAAEVAQLDRRLRSPDADTAGALREFAEAIADPVADRTIAVLLLHLQDHAEGLSTVLGDIARSGARSVAQRQEALATREDSFTALRFMVVFILITLGLLVTIPSTSRALHSTVGQMVLVMFFVTGGGIFAWVRSMCRPPRPTRLLGPVGRPS